MKIRINHTFVTGFESNIDTSQFIKCLYSLNIHNCGLKAFKMHSFLTTENLPDMNI